MNKPIIASDWICGCAGCHMSLLDMDERILKIVELADLRSTPITDLKEPDESGVDVGILEGGIPAAGVGGAIPKAGLNDPAPGRIARRHEPAFLHTRSLLTTVRRGKVRSRSSDFTSITGGYPGWTENPGLRRSAAKCRI